MPYRSFEVIKWQEDALFALILDSLVVSVSIGRPSTVEVLLYVCILRAKGIYRAFWDKCIHSVTQLQSNLSRVS